MRKRITSWIAMLTLLFGSIGVPVPAVAQQVTSYRVAGDFVASAYGRYTMYATNAVAAGAATMLVSKSTQSDPNGSCFIDTAGFGSTKFTPLFVGASLRIQDNNAETVTVTGVNTTAGSCSLTATFINAHNGLARVQSASGGLYEAIQAAYKIGGGRVVVDQDFYALGGTNAIIVAATPYSTVSLVDKSGSQYWNVTPATTTVLATPTALTAQAACDATHNFCSDGTVAGSASWGGAIHCGITYVDILGNESITSTDATFTSVASKAIDITSPAASTGAVGWKPYCSLSGGSYALMYSIPLVTQPSAVGSYPVSNGTCTLTNLEIINPACSLVNTSYGQTASVVGANGTFTGGAQITGYPVVTSQLAPNLDSASSQSLNPSNGGLTIYKYAPSSHPFAGIQQFFMSFPITTAAQSTIGQVAGTIPLSPGFMNYVGRTIEVCGMLSKTNTTADTITNIQLWWDAEGSNVTAGTAVQLTNIQITQTLTAAASIPFCQDITTTVASASATGGTIQPGTGWLTEAQVAAGTIHTGSSNILFAAVGSLNLALQAKLEVVYNHTTGTDGAGVVLLNPTVRILN